MGTSASCLHLNVPVFAFGVPLLGKLMSAGATPWLLTTQLPLEYAVQRFYSHASGRGA